MVVAADQGRRPGFPRVLPGPVLKPRTVNTGPVLVTGAAGFAGSHLVEHVRGTGAAVVCWDRQDLDLLDRDTVRARIRDLRPSAIYHCAGAPHVGQSWENTAHPLS